MKFIENTYNRASSAAVLPETTHHVTTKHFTTTSRPTPERYEQTNNFYLYDRDSHYFCVSHHSIRVHYHYCLCYHLPYEHRGELNDPMLLLKTEKLMFELYDAGYYVQLPLKELEYYSHRNYAMCTHTNGKMFSVDREHAHAVLCGFTDRVINIRIIGLAVSPVKKYLRGSIRIHERQLVLFIKDSNKCS
uniref:Uncharacterized protein n=1 Tax=Magallana gigas TaxID=29159 RepID=A0A8W8J617_MAGGI